MRPYQQVKVNPKLFQYLDEVRTGLEGLKQVFTLIDERLSKKIDKTIEELNKLKEKEER